MDKLLDADALNRVLEREKTRYEPGGIIVHLAWNVGLFTHEIQNLRWSDISMEEKTLQLPDRTIPLDEDMLPYIQKRHSLLGKASIYVVHGFRNRNEALTRTSINRLFHKATEKEPMLNGITLLDLRRDFIAKQLQKHDWQYVSRIAGINGLTLQGKAKTLSPEPICLRPDTEKRPEKLDAAQLREMLLLEGTSIAGTVIRLVWDGGLQLIDVANLKWNQIDFATQRIHLEQKSVEISADLTAYLHELRKTHEPDGYVLHSRTGNPFPIERLSVLCRRAFVNAGMDHISLKHLSLFNYDNELEKILAYVRNRNGCSPSELREAFQLKYGTLKKYTSSLIEKKELVMLNNRFYLPGTVVEKKNQFSVIKEYLEAQGVAPRKELADVLQLTPTQASFVLSQLVAEGKLAHNNRKYSLPKTDF